MVSVITNPDDTVTRVKVSAGMVWATGPPAGPLGELGVVIVAELLSKVEPEEELAYN